MYMNIRAKQAANELRIRRNNLSRLAQRVTSKSDDAREQDAAQHFSNWSSHEKKREHENIKIEVNREIRKNGRMKISFENILLSISRASKRFSPLFRKQAT